MSKGKPTRWFCLICGNEKVLGEKCVACGADSDEISEQYRLEKIGDLEAEPKVLRAATVPQQEVKITFTGSPGSGKTTLLHIAGEAIQKAGHKVLIEDHILSCTMKVSLFTSFSKPKEET